MVSRTPGIEPLGFQFSYFGLDGVLEIELYEVSVSMSTDQRVMLTFLSLQLPLLTNCSKKNVYFVEMRCGAAVWINMPF
jgi:hypothetical protein